MAGSNNTTCFYVYVHYKLSDGKPFYVGKGKGNRYLHTTKRNAKWKAIYNKHGLDSYIIFDNLEEKEALALEVDAIAELRYFGYNLANLTNGGESNSGRVVSKETREKIRAARIGKKPSPESTAKGVAKRTGMKRTPEQRERMGAWSRGVPLNEKHKEKLRAAKLGKKLTEAHKKKIGDVSRGKRQRDDWVEKRASPQRKPVRCVTNGLEFNGLASAAKWVFDNGIGKNHKECISRCCRGKSDRAYGLQWEYIDRVQ